VTGLTSSKSYKFKVRAKNIYGHGDFSTEATFEASDKPGKPSIPTVVLDGTKVKVTWLKPAENGSPINGYEVSFRKLDGSFAIDTTNCNGLIDPVLSAKTCSVPMTSIPTLTNLAVDSLIQVRVRAKNNNNFGEYSEKNTVGQVVHTVPLKMPDVTYNFNEITNTQIIIHWVARTGTDAGGTGVTVDNYKLEVESNTPGTFTPLTTTTNL
jgi:hypothetical protein